MDLRELGTKLREERERQGLSLEAVSDKIKISRSCLAAIEEGNESCLPHPVYAKGFMKNYAQLLGMDQEAVARWLTEVYQLEEPSLSNAPILQGVAEEGEDVGKPQGRRTSKVRLFPIVAVAVVVLLAAGVGWFLYARVLAKSGSAPEAPAARTSQAPAAPAAPTASAQPERPVPTVPAAEPSTAPAPVAPEQAPAEAQSLPPATQAGSKPAPTPEDQATQDIADSGPGAGAAPATIPPAPPQAPSAQPATIPPAPAAAGAKVSPTLSVGESGPHTVVITAKDRCWVQAGADGGSMREATLTKGEVFEGRFADYLLVRLGNAGAVEIRFDDKLYPLHVGKSAVKTLKFVAKKTEGDAAPTPPAAETPQPAAPAAAAAAQPAAGEATAAKEVEIYGQDGSWVIVNPDKGPSKEIYVKKGQRLTVPFEQGIEIRLGNPSNVVFRYAGKETPVTTGKGETKTVRFP